MVLETSYSYARFFTSDMVEKAKEEVFKKKGIELIKKIRFEKMQYNDIVRKLKSLSNPRVVKGMAKYGITPERTYGVSIPNLRKIAKEIGKDYELAQKLWELNIREIRILASMIDDPELVTEQQMERWVKEFDYWEICLYQICLSESYTMEQKR